MKFSNFARISPLTILVLAACGGSDSNSTPEATAQATEGEVVGLTMPEIISIVSDSSSNTVQQKVSSAPAANLSAKTSLSMKPAISMKPYNGADSDFTLDKTRAYVWDESMGPMQMVNQILCYVGQTRADKFVNATYTALVDTCALRKK